METHPYDHTDLDWLTPSTRGWFDTQSLRRMVDPALSVSFYEADTYLASAGIYQLWPGVYEAWLVVQTPPRHWWGFVGAIRRALALGERMTQAHRIQAYSLASFPQGIVLARRLGFQLEGVLRCATPTRDDIHIYARVR